MSDQPLWAGENLNLSIGRQIIFDDADMYIASGERVALIGRNGGGKSTLLKIVAGMEQPSSGNISVSKGCRIAYMPQDPVFESDKNVGELVAEGLQYFEELLEYIKEFRSDNVFAIAELIYHGVSLEKLHEITMITPYFLQSFKSIIDMEEVLRVNKDNETLIKAKKMGFSDKYIAKLWKCSELDVYDMRKKINLFPAFKMVDTCHTGAYIPYFYSSYTGENTSRLTDKKKIVVLGAGPIRIGQGVEFDYSTVHAVTTIKNSGYEAIIINNNPETVSTDYTTADKLYFALGISNSLRRFSKAFLSSARSIASQSVPMIFTPRL